MISIYLILFIFKKVNKINLKRNIKKNIYWIIISITALTLMIIIWYMSTLTGTSTETTNSTTNSTALIMLSQSILATFYTSPGLMLLFLLMWFIISLAMAVYVFNDAKKHKSVDQNIWFLIVAITGLLGFIGYMIVRK